MFLFLCGLSVCPCHLTFICRGAMLSAIYVATLQSHIFLFQSFCLFYWLLGYVICFQQCLGPSPSRMLQKVLKRECGTFFAYDWYHVWYLWRFGLFIRCSRSDLEFRVFFLQCNINRDIVDKDSISLLMFYITEVEEELKDKNASVQGQPKVGHSGFATFCTQARDCRTACVHPEGVAPTHFAENLLCCCNLSDLRSINRYPFLYTYYWTIVS